MTERARVMSTYTVGRVAELLGVTVRTLHHYDEIGLLAPSDRSRAGYRLYTDADLTRLQQIVVYRRLELPLDEIAALLADGADAADHLRRQRATVMSRLGELQELVAAIDRALEREMGNQPATPEEMKELFGDGFGDEYEQEAQERWGDTDAWTQSAERTRRYTKADWQQVKAEMDAAHEAFASAKRAGLPPTSTEAMDAAEQHRQHIHHRFYDLSHEAHRGLADLYVSDARFTKTYDDVEPGLAAYVRDAIHANSHRHAG
ncbi:MAG TPA: MerR family transcriptional regulator [Intrasporangium sp.]|uniref:MerR family transcriptional regulator n=1 Tax=Intrasporangium sp. TaxID=1925024 RepID=UPI002D7A25BC|nr:MerR family transcriptional regulator [Intrasporangium sp.]HET7399433.1 MerR family transcriptional regulator [Intrasporangium sp.]